MTCASKRRVPLPGVRTRICGSGELNLLAGSLAAITATAADKFYFYDARILAAQNVTDPQAKIQLLSHCIIDFPRRDEARVPLFKAAVTAHSDEYAVAVIEPLFQTRFLRDYDPQKWQRGRADHQFG